MPSSPSDLLDIYVCFEGQLAERVLEILQEAGVEALLRDRSSSPFPLPVGTADQRVIAVAPEQAELARQCISAAIEDEVLSDEGKLY